MLDDPALADFRDWAAGSGQRWQLVSFVRHAAVLVRPAERSPRRAAGLRLRRLRRLRRRPAARVARARRPAVVDAARPLARRRRGRPRRCGVATPAARPGHRGHRRPRRLPARRVRVLRRRPPRGAAAPRRPARPPVGRPRPRRRARHRAASPPEPPSTRRRQHVVRPAARAVTAVQLATTALATSIVLAAFFGNELRSQDYDPQFMKVLVDRVEALGVTYYEGALHNKGPFEPFVYRVAAVADVRRRVLAGDLGVRDRRRRRSARWPCVTTARVAGTSQLVAAARRRRRCSSTSRSAAPTTRACSTAAT